jgi:hypothetical protein
MPALHCKLPTFVQQGKGLSHGHAAYLPDRTVDQLVCARLRVTAYTLVPKQALTHTCTLVVLMLQEVL